MSSHNLRWRIVDGEIPLLNRHYRALDPLNLPEPLRAWIHERLEWAADSMQLRDKNAVICLAIDTQNEVVVSIEDLRPKPVLNMDNIYHSRDVIVGVKYQDQPLQGTVWIEKSGKLTAALTPFSITESLTTATDTLALQLAQTLGIATEVSRLKIKELSKADAVFLISDEFGFILISGDANKGASAKIADCFNKVFG